MSDAENQRSSVPQIEAVVIDKCSIGLIDKIRVPITQSRLGLDVVNSRQAELADRVFQESENLLRLKEEFNIEEAVKKTRFYHQKLENVHKEMLNLSDRAANLKARSLKLLDAKQEEALKRENQRQLKLEREEQLVAKPAPKKSN